MRLAGTGVPVMGMRVLMIAGGSAVFVLVGLIGYGRRLKRNPPADALVQSIAAAIAAGWRHRRAHMVRWLLMAAVMGAFLGYRGANLIARPDRPDPAPPAVRVYPATARAYTATVLAAWQDAGRGRGRATLEALTTSEALAFLLLNSDHADQGWTFTGCDDAGGLSTCRYFGDNDGFPVVLVVDNTRAGGPQAVVRAGLT